jgi:amino acid adenylation domain-containing protein
MNLLGSSQHSTNEGSYIFPASFAQQRLWFLDQLAPANAFYNLSGAIPLNVPVDAALFAECLNAIVRRHEALRTTFETGPDGEVVQVIKAHMSIPVPVIDLRHLPPKDRAGHARDAAIREAAQPFDLHEGPLIRAKVVTLDDKDHVLLLTLHHIISDGWSMGILWNELSTLYSVFQQKLPSPLKDLQIQYADYAVWQRKWMHGDVFRRQMAYWKLKLHLLPVLQLPTDHPRPAMLSYSGGAHKLKFPPHLVADLRRLSQNSGVTLFMTLLAAFQVLLQRYCGQDDIVVGTPVAGRNRRELEPLIAFFVNTVVMRSDLSGDPTFHEVLRRVRATTLEAYANQELPFEKLVEELQPERDLSSNPLFRVSFQLFSNPAGIAASNDDLRDIGIERSTSVFDLACNLVEGPQSLSGSFEFSTDLFDVPTIQQLARHFQTLLENIVRDPGAHLSNLEILQPSERDGLLHLLQGEKREPALTCRVHEAIQTHSEDQPDMIAITDGDRTCTYRALQTASNTLARRLQDNKVSRGDVVGVCLDRSIEMVAAMLACWKTGAAYLPIDSTYPRDRIEFMLRDAGASAVLSNSRFSERLDAVEIPVLPVDERYLPDGEALSCAVRPDDLAYVIYTSGSTGAPKGVEISHRNLENLASWHNATYHVTAQDRATQVAGTAYDACVWEIWPYLVAGASVNIASDHIRLQPAQLASWMADRVITLAFLPTPLASLFFDQQLPANLRLRVLMTGGEKLLHGPKYPVPFDVVNHYGPTEYTVVTTFGAVKAQLHGAEDGRASSSPPIGRPIFNTNVYVVDRDLRLAPPGVPGELCITGAGLARAYRGRPSLTAEHFVPDPFSTLPGARMYRTGDLVRYSGDGQVEFLGRRDSQVKIRGSRVEPGEVEAAILAHPAVRQVAVTSVHSSGPGEQTSLAAYVVRGESELPSASEMKHFLQQSLPDYMIPSLFFRVDALPMTPNGKIDRDTLPAPGSAEPLESPAITDGRDHLEELIADCWAELMGVDRVGVLQNFFSELGGHSLIATQLIARMRQLLHIDFPLQRIFEAPTVAEFASAIRQNAAEWATAQTVISVLLQLEHMTDQDVSLMLDAPPTLSLPRSQA